MSNGDYGYFGKGDAGYAQYMTAFNRNFGGSSGGGGGGNHLAAVVGPFYHLAQALYNNALIINQHNSVHAYRPLTGHYTP